MKPKERIPLHDHSGFNAGGLVAASTVVTSFSVPTAPPSGGGASAAAAVSVADVADNFAGSNVETVLAEIMADIAALALDDLADVTAPAPADGDALTWTGAAWAPVHAVTEDDVIALITPDVYACASLTVISAKGSIAAGAHTDLHAVGGTTVQINETATTPGFNIEAAFTGVDGITDLHVHGYYTAAHTATVELYNYDTTAWDVAITMPTSQSVMGLLSASIAVGTPYFDGGGNAKVRFYHAQAGNPTHRLYLDYLALSHAVSTGGALALDGLSDVNAAAPNNGDVLTWDSTPGEWVPVAPGAGGGDTVGQLVAGWDGGGSALTAGKAVDIVAPFTGTITSWTLLPDQSGSAVVGIGTDNYAGFPTFTSIVASDPPTLATATKATGSALTGWTTAVTAGDILRFTLSSASTVTRLLCVVAYSRP